MRTRLPLIDQVPLASPFTVHLETNNVCNFECSFCPHALDTFYEEQNGRHFLSLEEHALIIDQILELAPTGIKRLAYFFMGEPLLHPKLPEMINLAFKKRAAAMTQVFTNGVLLKGSMAQRLLLSGLDELRISVYGTTEEEYQTFTRRKYKLEDVVNNAKSFLAERKARGLKTPLLEAKYHGVGEKYDEFVKTWESVADRLIFAGTNNWTGNKGRDLSGMGKTLFEQPYMRESYRVCPWPFFMIAINSDLTVVPCCADWAREVQIGTLKTETLKQIWEGPVRRQLLEQQIRDRSKIKGCNTCTSPLSIWWKEDDLDNLTLETYLARFQCSKA